MIGRCLEHLHGMLLDKRGIAAVEFALTGPLFLLILVGTIDIGAAAMVRFRLDAAVSAAAGFAVAHAAQVTSSDGQALATTLANLASGVTGTPWSDSSAIVNAGPSAAVTNGTATTGNTGGSADACHCPTRSGSTVTWGASVACGAACPTVGVSGAFVVVMASKTYAPLFPAFGYGGLMTATAVVETK